MNNMYNNLGLLIDINNPINYNVIRTSIEKMIKKMTLEFITLETFKLS